MISTADKELLLNKLFKALESDENLTRQEFEKMAGRIYSEVMKSNKDVEKKEVEKEKRKPNRWNYYLQQKIAEMTKEDEDKPKNERRTSRDMFKIASDLWNAGDNLTFA